MNNLKTINNELITLTKSEFLKNEINQAFFIWNQNEYFSKDFNEMNKNEEDSTLFLDWLIYDYDLITTQKPLVCLYWEENKDNAPAELINTFRSIFKFKKEKGNFYTIKDIIRNLKYTIELYDEVPNDSSLLSLRIVKIDGKYKQIGHIVAYSNIYNRTIENCIFQTIKEGGKSLDILNKNSFFIIERKVNNLIAKFNISTDKSVKVEAFQVKDYNSIYQILRNNKNLEILTEDKESLSIFNYYDKKHNHFASIELKTNRIIFNDFKKQVLDKIKLQIVKFISEDIDEITEIWLNSKLKVLNNQSPMDAIKNKKNLKKIKDILRELYLIYDSRVSDEEPCINPYYVEKKLGL